MRYGSGKQAPNRDVLYGRRWKYLGRVYLRANPLCRYCEQIGRLTPADLVDHVVPHKGDATRFWDQSNWQPLCTPCHNSVKQREESGRGRPGCTLEGIPVDPQHPWAAEATTGGRD